MAQNVKPFEFRENSLYLAAPSGGQLRLRWYPLPEAHMRLASGHWHPYEPEFRILAPSTPLPADMPEVDKERLQAKYDAFQAFRAGLPGYIVDAVEPFTCHQWPLMRLLKRSVPARDLAKANPVLAYALASPEQFCPSLGPEVAILQAVRYSRRKQREILGWLGFPATEAMVRLIKKIPVAIVYPGLIRKLRQCVAFPEMLKLFAHLPILNTGVMFLCSHPDMAPLMTSKLLVEVALAADEEMAAPTADQLHEIITVMEKVDARDRLRPLRSRRDVEEWHGRMALIEREYNERLARQEEIKRLNEAARGQLEKERAVAAQRRLKKMEFPPPPVPGTTNIVPLRSFPELVEESDAQANCVGRGVAYAQQVMNGTTYIYRVLAPERHTLSIVNRGGAGRLANSKFIGIEGAQKRPEWPSRTG